MQKILLILILVIGFFSAKAQNEINQFDAHGKRNGLWRKEYENGKVRYTGTFSHGKEIGVFKFYSMSSSDHPIIIKTFNKNSAYVDVQFFDESGFIESKGKMIGKNREGKWLFYHKDGKTVMSEENYKNGKLDGDFKTFFEDGKPTEIASYKNGLLEGNYKKYSIRGTIYLDFNYSKGKLNGMATYYSRKTGEIQRKGPFKDDLRVGTWENYYEGELISTEQPALRKSSEDEEEY